MFMDAQYMGGVERYVSYPLSHIISSLDYEFVWFSYYRKPLDCQANKNVLFLEMTMTLHYTFT